MAATFAQTLAPSKILCTPAARWGLFRESDTITIQATNNLPIEVTDLDGNVVYQGVPTSLGLARGHYFVSCSNDAAEFAVLPDDYAGAPFLGMEALPPGNDTNVISAINPSWLRLLGGSGALWPDVQPSAGVWNWTTADQVIANNAGNGRKLIWVAFFRPPWLTDDTQFLSLYSNYVSRVAQRYGSQLYAIEVWNEPWTTCDLWGRLPNLDDPNQCMTNWHQMAESYLHVLQTASSAVKSVAPNLRVIGPAWSNPNYGDVTAYLNQLGATSMLDALTFHDYGDGGTPPPDQLLPVGSTGALNQRLGQGLQDFWTGLGTTSTPLLVDEVGLYGQSALGIPNTGDPTYLSGISWQRGMYRATKMMLLYRAGGAQAFIPHVLYTSTTDVNSNLEVYGFEGGGRGPHPKTSATLMTSYWLNGATPIGYRTPGSNVFLYAWQLADNTSLVTAWALEGQTVPLSTSGLPQPTDIYGRAINVTALTEEPVLFHSNNSDAMGLLNSIRANILAPSNFAPIFNSLPTESIVAGQPLQFTVSATDMDNDPIIYSASVLPPGATFDPATHTFSWTPGLSANGPYTATFVATDSLGANTSLSTTITVLGNLFDNLLAHWTFDESNGTMAADSAGANNGTLTGFNFTSTSGWGPGIISNALSFDGVNDFVALDSNQINLTNNFSIALWLKPQNAAAQGVFLSVRSSYQSSGLRFFVAGNTLMLQGQTPAGYLSNLFATNAMVDGSWSHVAVVYDNSNLSVYLNGALQGTTNWAGDFVMNPAAPSSIGTEGSYYFSGAIDDTMIFQRALTSAQVLALYQSANLPLTISALQGILNFAKTNADTCTVKGAFALPANYDFTGKLLTLTIGGVSTAFTLDSNGRGLNGLSRVNRPSYNKTTGSWTFNILLRNGSWQTSWAAYGLVNADILRPGAPVTLPVTLVINGTSFAGTAHRQYMSHAGKSGNIR